VAPKRLPPSLRLFEFFAATTSSDHEIHENQRALNESLKTNKGAGYFEIETKVA